MSKRRPWLSRSINHQVIVRAPGLLPMQYRPRELAEELGVAQRTLMDWLKLGVPHRRDARGHVWVNGREFAAWLSALRARRPSRKMALDEAYCFVCSEPVRPVNPTVRRCGRISIMSGNCPHCGTVVNRGLRNGESR